MSCTALNNLKLERQDEGGERTAVRSKNISNQKPLKNSLYVSGPRQRYKGKGNVYRTADETGFFYNVGLYRAQLLRSVFLVKLKLGTIG